MEIFHSHPSLFPGRHFLLPLSSSTSRRSPPTATAASVGAQGRQQKLHGRRAPFHGRASLPPAHRSTSLRSASLTRCPCSRRAQLHLPVLSSSPCPAPPSSPWPSTSMAGTPLPWCPTAARLGALLHLAQRLLLLPHGLPIPLVPLLPHNSSGSQSPATSSSSSPMAPSAGSSLPLQCSST
jgi:hypothetical protein